MSSLPFLSDEQSNDSGVGVAPPVGNLAWPPSNMIVVCHNRLSGPPDFARLRDRRTRFMGDEYTCVVCGNSVALDVLISMSPQFSPTCDFHGVQGTLFDLKFGTVMSVCCRQQVECDVPELEERCSPEAIQVYEYDAGEFDVGAINAAVNEAPVVDDGPALMHNIVIHVDESQ